MLNRLLLLLTVVVLVFVKLYTTWIMLTKDIHSQVLIDILDCPLIDTQSASQQTLNQHHE